MVVVSSSKHSFGVISSTNQSNREFITEVAKLGFSPEVGLFKQTPSKQLYPNPASQIVHGGNTQFYD